LRLDLDDIMAHPQSGDGGARVLSASSSHTVLVNVEDGYGTFAGISRGDDDYL
jgi:hypothetical protein